MMTQRRQFRMPVSRSGLLTKGHTTSLCELIDITEDGVQLSTDVLLATNEIVRIECQLDADCIIHCELVITHAEAPRFGGRIMHLSPEHQQQLALFIQRLIVSTMAGF